MEKWNVLALPKRLLRPYKHAAAGIIRRILPQKKRLLFVFGGRTQYWPGMGRELYEQEPVFRNTIHQCNEHLERFAGVNILSNFTPDHPVAHFEDEAFTGLVIASIQIGLCDLYRSKGIVPNAVMGVNRGDVTAVYAAGGLTLEDTCKVMADCANMHQAENNNFVPLYLQSNLKFAQELSKEAPVFVAPIYEAGDHSVLAICNKEDKAPLGYYFESKGIARNVPHSQTALSSQVQLKQDPEKINQYSESIQPLPLHTDFYSSSWGRCVPAGSIIPNTYWPQLPCNQAPVDPALQAITSADMEVIVNIGPQTIKKEQVIHSTGNKNIEALESISRIESEMKSLQQLQHTLSGYRFYKPGYR